MLNGRVKTLHPKIHAGILSKRSNKKHIREMKKKIQFYRFNNCKFLSISGNIKKKQKIITKLLRI